MPPWPVPQLIAWIERVETQAARATMFELLEVPSSADSKAVQTAFLRVAAGAHPDLHRHTLPPSDAERLMRAYAKVAAAYDTLRDQRTRDKYRKEVSERGRPASPAPVIGGAQPPPPRAGSSAPPFGQRATGSSPPGPSVPRTTTPPNVARTTTSPHVARTTTSPNVARTTTSPNVARTTTPAEVASGSASGFGRTTGAVPAARSPSKSPDERPPLITAAPVTEPRTPSATAPRTKPPSRPPAMTTPGSASRGPGESRPPGSGLGGRAQVYFRKAQSCLNRGDLGGALFNLRLAAAADPSSSVIRVALAEVEAELGTKKP